MSAQTGPRGTGIVTDSSNLTRARQLPLALQRREDVLHRGTHVAVDRRRIAVLAVAVDEVDRIEDLDRRSSPAAGCDRDRRAQAEREADEEGQRLEPQQPVEARAAGRAAPRA